jgi:hypothetical protein
VSLYGSARHLELAGDLGVVTTLQKQFDDLLFARSKPNALLVHHFPLGLDSPGLRDGVQLGCFQIT